MNAMIVNIYVESPFQTLWDFDTNTSKFDYRLIITINDSGLTKISLENWSRSHQGQLLVTGMAAKCTQTWISEGKNKSVRICGCWNCEAMIIHLIPKVKVTHNAFFLFSWHIVFRGKHSSVIGAGYTESKSTPRRTDYNVFLLWRT